MKTLDELGRYLEEVTGKPPALRELPQGKERGVPLFLRSTYRPYSAHLFGRRFAFAVEQGDPGGATPLTRAKHVELLRTALGTDVALVLHGVPTHDRNRLVRRGVPFVVPGRQMYLPFLAMDLRERDHRLSRVDRKAVSAAAQAVVLRRLLGRPVEDLTLAELAEATGYSAMTMTNVGDELERLGLCAVAREGRTRRIVFDTQGAELWERARPLLRDPVRTTRWARKWSTRTKRRIVAGLSALARYTSIAEDGVLVFALWHKDYRAQVDRGEIVGCEGPDEAEVAIECWTYDPARLADGDRVDRLSLYLALRTTSDERVEKELRVLLEGVEW
jgi:DNA-binding MarR family transcriptional regulator